MTWPVREAHKRRLHESVIRSVVDFANEVRISMRNSDVIFGTMVAAPMSDAGSFHLRPWGVVSAKAIHFDDVAVAAPVKNMGWAKHRGHCRRSARGNLCRSSGFTSLGRAATPVLCRPAQGRRAEARNKF